jgi:hypothetical protein
MRLTRHSAAPRFAGPPPGRTPTDAHPAAPDRRPTVPQRPRTPRDPNRNDQSSMWPDPWAAHRR